MKQLFWDQLLYLWQIIKQRLLFWLILISLAIVLSNIPFSTNPHYSVFTSFFAGVDFITIHLPINWFIYFIIPMLIMLNSFRQLWHARVIQLRGLQYSARTYAKINIELLGLISLVYVLITESIQTLCTLLLQLPMLRINYLSGVETLGLNCLVNWLGILWLLLLQAIINHFNAPLGIIIPITLLIATVYTLWKNNPLNSLMLLRINQNNIISLVITTIITAFIYLLVERHTNFE